MNERIEKIKQHVKDHKVAYIFGATAVVSVGITCLVMRESHAVLDAGADWTKKSPVDSLSVLSGRSLFGPVTNNAVTTIHKGSVGNPGFVTRCIETGEIFATQGDAARAFGISEEFLSKHLNYGRELIENLHFERLGVLAA